VLPLLNYRKRSTSASVCNHFISARLQSSNIAIAPSSSAVKSIPNQFLHLEWLIDSLQLWTADKFEYGERNSIYGFVFLTTMQSTVAIGEAPAAAVML